MRATSRAGRPSAAADTPRKIVGTASPGAARRHSAKAARARAKKPLER